MTSREKAEQLIDRTVAVDYTEAALVDAEQAVLCSNHGGPMRICGAAKGYIRDTEVECYFAILKVEGQPRTERVPINKDLYIALRGLFDAGHQSLKGEVQRWIDECSGFY